MRAVKQIFIVDDQIEGKGGVELEEACLNLLQVVEGMGHSLLIVNMFKGVAKLMEEDFPCVIFIEVLA